MFASHLQRSMKPPPHPEHKIRHELDALTVDPTDAAKECSVAGISLRPRVFFHVTQEDVDSRQ